MAEADTNFFRTVGGLPGSGTVCPKCQKCGLFHEKCPGLLSNEDTEQGPSHQWGMCTTDNLLAFETKDYVVAYDGIGQPGNNYVIEPECDPECPMAPATTDGITCADSSGSCQQYLNCIHDCVTEIDTDCATSWLGEGGTDPDCVDDTTCHDALTALYTQEGSEMNHGYVPIVEGYLDCIADPQVLNCAEKPSDFRHWNLLLFGILLCGGLFFACVTQGWFVPFCQKINEVKNNIKRSNPMVKETIYTPATPP